jgi:hypothetical protein
VGDPPRWPRDTPLSTKVGTEFLRQVAVAQSVYFARWLRATEKKNNWEDEIRSECLHGHLQLLPRNAECLQCNAAVTNTLHVMKAKNLILYIPKDSDEFLILCVRTVFLYAAQEWADVWNRHIGGCALWSGTFFERRNRTGSTSFREVPVPCACHFIDRQVFKLTISF